MGNVRATCYGKAKAPGRGEQLPTCPEQRSGRRGQGAAGAGPSPSPFSSPLGVISTWGRSPGPVHSHPPNGTRPRRAQAWPPAWLWSWAVLRTLEARPVARKPGTDRQKAGPLRDSPGPCSQALTSLARPALRFLPGSGRSVREEADTVFKGQIAPWGDPATLLNTRRGGGSVPEEEREGWPRSRRESL